MTHDIVHRPLSELTNISFSCACGHEHRIQIGTLAVGPGASSQVAGAARAYAARRILLVADVHTFEVLGKSVLEQLKGAGLDTDAYVFPDQHLHPYAFAVGRLFLEASDEKADYYAFSDQDDYWHKDKLSAGITNIDKMSKEKDTKNLSSANKQDTTARNR